MAKSKLSGHAAGQIPDDAAKKMLELGLISESIYNKSRETYKALIRFDRAVNDEIRRVFLKISDNIKDGEVFCIAIDSEKNIKGKIIETQINLVNITRRKK